MQILTLNSTLRSLAFTAFRNGTGAPVLHRQLKGSEGVFDFDAAGSDPFSSISCTLENAGMLPLDVIAVRGLYGGDRFTRPVFASEPVLADLTALAPQAPLHVPHLVQLVKAARRAFPQTPVALVFETAFFVPLPERERRYGVDPELIESRSLRRFGFHGIFHEAACLDAARKLRSPEPRILSICLEPRPELAACRGRLPVMVTGGSTPVEGLPGETSCGDLDPSVVLKLADDRRWGPEGTSRLLTCDSGLRGLAGRDVSLAEVLQCSDGDLQLARDVFLNCLLRACGAGIAALGGLDAIVYTGRYANSAPVLHDWLNGHLSETIQRDTTCLIHSHTLPQHLRDIAYVMVRENGVAAAV
jgi:acetate kinase